MLRKQKIKINASSKAARRVIAPYVKVMRKNVLAQGIPESNLFKKHLGKRPSLLLRDLSSVLSDDVDLPSLLHESAEVLKSTTHAHGVSLYLVEYSTGEIYQSQKYFDIAEPRVRWRVEEGTIVAAHVAFRKELVMIDDILQDERFPMGIGQKDQLTKSVLCVPVTVLDGEVQGVIELFRDTSQDPFTTKDMRIVKLLADWMGAAIEQNTQRLLVQKKQELNEYLLELTKVFVEEFVPMEYMISELLKFMKAILNTEKCGFYLLHNNSEELMSDVYETTVGDSDKINKVHKIKLIDSNKATVTTVAQNGQMANIKQPYRDEIDDNHYVVVRSQLCMAVKGSSKIFGVIELLNKKAGCFTKSDEIITKVFAKYFLLVLLFNRIDNKLRKEEVTNNLVVDIVNRQSGPCIHDFSHMMRNLDYRIPAPFYEFDWSLPENSTKQIPVLAFAMIRDFVPANVLNIDNLARVLLGLKKYNSHLLYHNFENSFYIMHCTYNIIKRKDSLFSTNEKVALLLASISGYIRRFCPNSEFLILCKHHIAQIFPDVPWNEYSYMITSMLLTHFPIFKNVSDEEYKEFLNELKLCSIHFQHRLHFFGKNLTNISNIIKSNSFDNNNPEHHFLLKILCGGCAVFARCAKPYLTAQKMLDDCSDDYLHEGKLIQKIEPKCTLIPLYSKHPYNTIAELQVQLIDLMILRMASYLGHLIPNTDSFLRGVTELRNTCLEVIILKGKPIWKQGASYRKKRD